MGILIDKKYATQSASTPIYNTATLYNTAIYNAATHNPITLNTTAIRKTSTPYQNVGIMPASGSFKRQGWTEEERKEIYQYAHTHPNPTWRGIKRWFEDKHASKISSQSQISKILNPMKRPRGPSNASILDPQQVQHSCPDRKRL